MKVKKSILVEVIIWSLFALAIFTGTAKAQPASIGISPASIDTKVKPGASYTQSFTLTNNTNERLKFRASAHDMWYDEQNQRINGRAGSLPRSASLWVRFTPAEIIVEPNTSGVVKATITVPQSATGSFYTVPVFEAAPVERPMIQNVADRSAATASIGIRFRALMMLTTEQGGEYNVELMRAQIAPPSASSEMELSLDLRNRGTVHAKVRGAFAILDSKGSLAGRGSIDEKRFLPSQRNGIKSRWSGELKPGDYTCIVTLTYDRIGLEPTSIAHEIQFQVK